MTRRLQAAIEFRLDEPGIFDELDDLVPHDRIEKVLADRTIVADRSTGAPPRVRAQAAIVVDLVPGGLGGGPVERIATSVADQHPLQQGRF